MRDDANRRMAATARSRPGSKQHVNIVARGGPITSSHTRRRGTLEDSWCPIPPIAPRRVRFFPSHFDQRPVTFSRDMRETANGVLCVCVCVSGEW